MLVRFVSEQTVLSCTFLRQTVPRSHFFFLGKVSETSSSFFLWFFVIRFVIGRKDLVISLHASLFLLSAKALFLRVTDDSNPLLRKCLFLYITTSFFHPLVFSPFTMPFYTQCLKIIEKVAFNIASEASYVHILSGQK